ncbi:MAG: type II toxin-antitoxin system YafQ family toxin [Desulfococcaceae bacterium]
MEKRGKAMDKMKAVIRSLIAQEPMNPVHRDHKLVGNRKDRRECHIEADWLLICKIETDRIIFERTGNHSDLFKK